MSVKINEIGRVTEVRVLKPLGFGLDEAAKTAVSKWLFRPATRAGIPTPGRKTIKVRFVLHETLPCTNCRR